MSNEPYDDAAHRLAPHESHRRLFPEEAKDSTTLDCASCRSPIPVKGTVGFGQPLACPRCGFANVVDADGVSGFRIRPASLEVAVRRQGEAL